MVAAGRHPDAFDDFAWGDQVERVELDVDDDDSVRRAVRGVDAVVYLVHSMSDDDDFVEQDRAAAQADRRGLRGRGRRASRLPVRA